MVPYKGAPFDTPYIPSTTQGPILENPLKEVRDHVQGPCNYG